tara:strand:- start:833 stop:1045 length:213 start_codon:yes stop_codon:yes gene_type:complete
LAILLEKPGKERNKLWPMSALAIEVNTAQQNSLAVSNNASLLPVQLCIGLQSFCAMSQQGTLIQGLQPKF